MRTLISTLLLVAFTVVGLSGCDFGEQNVEWEPGASLMIRGPISETGGDLSEPAPSPEGHPVLIQPLEAFFMVEAFTAEKDYSWTVNGTAAGELETAEIVNDGEFLRVMFETPGTYTVEVSDGDLTGTQTVVVQNAT